MRGTARSTGAFLQTGHPALLVTAPPHVTQLTADAKRPAGLGHGSQGTGEQVDKGKLLLQREMCGRGFAPPIIYQRNPGQTPQDAPSSGTRFAGACDSSDWVSAY